MRERRTRRNERIVKATWKVGQFFAEDRWAAAREFSGIAWRHSSQECRAVFLRVFELRNTLFGIGRIHAWERREENHERCEKDETWLKGQVFYFLVGMGLEVMWWRLLA
jgi:hypothetical protein